MYRSLTSSKFFVPVSILLIAITAIITRLPQLYSPHLLLDEDECVLGLMAKHMVEGKEVALFFWGQVYGFSLVETSLISCFYFLFGMQDYSIKLAMLSIFIAGLIFFYKTLLVISPKNKWLALAITLLFILLPTWAVWSMKARGGYLTSFFLSSLCTWLLFKETRSEIITYLLIGVLLATIFYSQPLWLPGLVSLLALKMLHTNRYNRLTNLFAGAISTILIFELLKKTSINQWHPKVFELSPHHIQDMPSLLFDHLHGYYYLTFIYTPSPAAIVSAYLFMFLLIALVIVATWLVFKHFNTRKLFIFSVLSVLLTLAYTAFLTEHAPRYLLPISGFILMSLFIYLSHFQSFKIKLAFIAPFLICGAVATYSFKDYSFNPYNRQQLLGCVDYLQQHNLHYIFTNDVPTEWQILYYSKETIICRASNNTDRYPAYILQVNKAWQSRKQQTAVVDFSGDIRDMAPEKAIRVADKFFIVPAPDEQLLKDMEVKF